MADVFVNLIDGSGIGRRWSVDEAIKQIMTMFGVQFDPHLKDPFVRVTSYFAHSSNVATVLGSQESGRRLN